MINIHHSGHIRILPSPGRPPAGGPVPNPAFPGILADIQKVLCWA
ncbi:hypothetical protein Daudx_2262 [Candidatus Desulforudis audaxviator]|nr:hypothetical protein Daudx_2262 [Candidatus Desulforudis audaxviator]